MLSTVMRDLTFAYLRCASVSSSPRTHCDRCADARAKHWGHHSDLQLERCRPLAATSIPGIRSVSSDRYSSVLPGLHQLISTNLAAANNLGTSYPNFFDWQQQNQSSMLSQTRRFVALLSLQRCSDEFSRAHGCRHL
jgi:hypothetical protein